MTDAGTCSAAMDTGMMGIIKLGGLLVAFMPPLQLASPVEHLPLPIPTKVAVGPNASAPERHAAAELVRMLAKISGGSSRGFAVVGPSGITAQISVGWDAAVQLGVSAELLDGLGREGFLASTQSSDGVPAGSVVLSGGPGAPRGTLYAANHFMEHIGVQFFSQDTTLLPKSLPSLPILNTTFVPRMEYRDQFEYPLMQTTNASLDLNVHLGLTINGDHVERGAASIYAPPSMVHTSYALLCPPGQKCATVGQGIPSDLFKNHREWFWPPAPAAPGYGQLCWSNVSLQQYMIKQVKAYLDSAPNATIISVSQNDNYAQCESPAEKAINTAEDTAGGALFRAVNAIADAIKDDYAGVAVDTLAYQWSRPAPKITKPRDNVIIRLCNIECNFAEPLDSPSNAPFQKDLGNWAKISNRTYIWNYITNFGDFIAPFPNYFNLGPDVDYLVSNGVRGIFQEGAYTGAGGEMCELKDYLLGRMMFDPSRNASETIHTFLRGYYGQAAAPHILRYLQIMHESAHNHSYHMAFSFGGTTASYLTPATVLSGAQAFADARAVASGRDLEHVHRSGITMYWVMLHRWQEMVAFANTSQTKWPVEENIEDAFASFVYGVNLTEAAYGAPVKQHEGGPALDLTALAVALDIAPCTNGTKRVDPKPSPCYPIACPTNWTRNGTDIRLPCDTPATTQCSPGHALVHTVPTDIVASSVYNGHLNKTTGAWGAYGYSGWIQLSFPPGTLIGNMTAEFGMSPAGVATNALSLDGHRVKTWSQPMKSGFVMTWAPPGPVAATELRMTTTKDPSWVSYGYIQVFACT